MRRLEDWWLENPLDAIAVVPLDAVAAAAPAADPPPANGGEDVSSWLDEPLEPAVRALLADMRIGSDGLAHFANYADRATEICGLDALSHQTTFLQLAKLACGFAGNRDRLALAQSLARLARVGLEPLARRASQASAPP